MTDEHPVGRRTILRGLGMGVGVAALSAAAEAQPADPAEVAEATDRTDPHTSATFAALVDAVVPETPELGTELGQEHEPGGLAINLDEFLVTYVNTLFQSGAPVLGHVEDARLAEVVAGVLDAAAIELLTRGANTHDPGGHAPEGEDWSAGGAFAWLHREDRVRAVGLFDEDNKEFHTAALPGPVVEGDAGLVGQLVVAFTEVVYYSEWQGYEEGAGLTAPPSERSHPNDPDAVQSWRQTGYPGNADGYKALRGYAGRPNCALGEGRVWETIRVGEGPPLQLTSESGAFRENDYDTSDYEEVFSDEGNAPSGGLPAGANRLPGGGD